MPAGWNVRVTTFDSEGKPGSVRYFLAYEPDKERAVELVRKRVPVNKGEEAEAVAEVAGNELVGQNMRPGDVRRHGLTSQATCESGQLPTHRLPRREHAFGLERLGRRFCAAAARRFIIRSPRRPSLCIG